MKTSIIVLAASVVFGAAAFAGSQGCTSSSTDSGDDTGPDSTPTVDDCTACVAQTCRAETARCQQDPGCQAILFCIETANDGGGCTSDSTSVSSRCLYQQFAACQITRECDTSNLTGCSTACQDTVNPQCATPDGGTIGMDGGPTAATSAPECPSGDTSGATTCDTCAVANCASQNTACLMAGSTQANPTYNSQCNQLEACRGECRDTACIARCAVGYAKGVAASSAYDACLAASCATECAAPVIADAGRVSDASDAGDGGD
jgi:hypothetical protein